MTIGLGATVLVIPATALAATPTNDSFASATSITTLPFADTLDNAAATIEPGEVDACGYSTANSVWYTYAPSADSIVRFDLHGSSFYDQKVDLFQATGPSIGDLSLIGCASFGDSFLLHATAGATYYVRAEDIWSGGGTLHLDATLVVAPANDDFAAATPITSLPFTDNALDMTAATNETGEPVPSCTNSFSGQSVWYVYDATTSGSVSTAFGAYSAVVGMYRGTSLGSLVQVGCGNWYNTLATIHVDAGSRYYFQLVGTFQAVGANTFQIQVAPAPSAGFYAYPGDPSSFDTVQFGSNQYDPANVGISSFAWDFGDGSTATTGYAQHRYAADGDYTARLTAGTPDGRTATESQVVHVKTHDVAVTKLTVPTTASSGQTRQITVGISNTRYAETVQVQLSKSNASGGFDFVGTLLQSVPVRGGGRTTPFTFNYTFTSADATLGKVTFRADVTIQGARDALPADNTAIGLPTKVTR